MEQERAIIFVPVDGRQRWEAECLRHCDLHGYKVVALVVGGLERWGDLMAMTRAGEAEVVVVARAEHLPVMRVPRTEVVAS